MKGKQILFGSEARRKLQRGVDILSDAVRITLGPKGKLVVFKRTVPVFSLDGVTVAKQVELEDPIENMGAELIKNVARNTDAEAGDGTTTATILSQQIFREGMKAMAAGVDIISVHAGLLQGVGIVEKFLKKTSKPIKGKQDIKNVATISSRDPEIGSMVAEIVGTLGKDAIVSVEEVKKIGVESEIVEGYHIDQGLVAPHLMTHPERGQAILNRPYILATMQNIRTMSDIIPVLELVAKTESKSLLIVADDIASEGLATIVINKLRGILNVAAIRAPGIGEDKEGRVEDIALATGGQFFSETVGQKIDEAELQHLGRAESAIISATETIIIGGKAKPIMKKRIADLVHQIEESKSDYLKEHLMDRLGKLRGKVAVIRIGTISEEENREKRFRIEDAVRAAKSSLQEGIVPGGGMALYRAADEVDKALAKETDFAKRTGLQILSNAIRQPAIQIIDNTGRKGDLVLQETLQEAPRSNHSFGFNSDTGEHGNLIEQGVIDPAMVVRIALSNAVSIVGMFLRTEAVIADLPEKKSTEEDQPKE